jgi:small subunit ribosomal protein S8
MSKTDPIADTFTLIRNAVRSAKEDVMVPHSRLILKVCDILKRDGYIENFAEADLGNFHKIKIYLRYAGKKSVITQIKRVSKPGNRVYVRHGKIRHVLQGYGTAFISTSSGILTDKEAKEKGLGGEFVGMVW